MKRSRNRRSFQGIERNFDRPYRGRFSVSSSLTREEREARRSHRRTIGEGGPSVHLDPENIPDLEFNPEVLLERTAKEAQEAKKTSKKFATSPTVSGDGYAIYADYPPSYGEVDDGIDELLDSALVAADQQAQIRGALAHKAIARELRLGPN